MGRPLIPMNYMGEEYLQMKKTVIRYERHLLKKLGFSVYVEHPYKMIVIYLRILGLEKDGELSQKAWNYANDGLRTNIFVPFAVKAIACLLVRVPYCSVPWHSPSQKAGLVSPV